MKPPIFIIGNPRSGTTLLRLMMTCHQNIVIPPECGFAVWWYEKYKAWSASEEAPLTAFVSDVMTSRKIETWGLDAARLLQFLRECAPASYAAAVAAVYEYYGRSLQRQFKRWGDKNNFHLLHIAVLNEMFPDCHFVHIVRDGRDVACSYRELHHKTIRSAYAPSLPFDIVEIAKEWQGNLEKAASALDALPSGRVRHIRYEDLVRDPRATLDPLCKALGEPFDPQMLDYSKLNRERGLEPSEFLQWKEKTLSPPSLSAVGRFRSEMTGSEIEAFEEVARPVLHRYDYL